MFCCASICVSFQQLFTEKSNCQLFLVISIVMSTEFDRVEMSGKLFTDKSKM